MGGVRCSKQKKPGRTPGSSAEDVKRANRSAARHVGTIAASVTGANTVQHGNAPDTRMLKVALRVAEQYLHGCIAPPAEKSLTSMRYREQRRSSMNAYSAYASCSALVRQEPGWICNARPAYDT